MIFENISFIKPNIEFKKEFTYKNYAPMFRRKFYIDDIKNARLYVCGLGFGYYYINGKSVSEDKFTAPVSDYNKTLWYNSYDVTHLLKKGENVMAVWCGNGWYNEDMPSSWDFDKAEWRDLPKFILRLDNDGNTVLKSDENWKCTVNGPIKFNALRSGEIFDARDYDSGWNCLDFDDTSWDKAVIDANEPKGIFRECLCEGIREFEVYKGKFLTKTGDKKYLFDITQNISGYIRLGIKGKKGQELKIRYAEEINSDFSLQLNDMERHYPKTDFQTDRFICSGEYITWSPKFCYHGFRYIEIEGLENENEAEVSGVFVHQAVEKRSGFQCSDEFLNKLYKAGEFSVYSNMFYQLTDCPTREKLGWTNDAQSSTEQILTNFKAEKFFSKWLCDIWDNVRDNGEMSGIIPTAGWGYHWGNGPVSDGVLFEIPYRIYLHTGNTQPLINSAKYFDRYFEYLKTRTDKDGFVRFGLDDWARPQFETAQDVNLVPIELINALFVMNFYNIASLSARLSGKDDSKYLQKAEEQKNLVLKTFIDKDGYCTSNRQSAVALLIYYDVYTDLLALKKQLLKLLELHNYRHDCGMVGLRRLFIALNKIGCEEYAYKVLTAKGVPSFREWLDNGATTLWEYWPWYKHLDSKNHHMYSDFMSWIMKTVVGINNCDIAFSTVEIKPYFFKELDFAKGYSDTVSGRISVCWQRNGDKIRLEIEIPENITAIYKGKKLNNGLNVIEESE